MKLAIFGGSGRTGQHVVQQALAAGHEVVALARTPEKLAAADGLQVVAGDVTNPDAVNAVIAGADAVLSVLGPTSNTPEYLVSRGMAHILAAMQEHGVQRLVVSVGAAVSDPADEPKLINRIIGFLVRYLSHYVYEDMRQVAEQVRASDRDWTIVRVPMLHDGAATGRVRVGMVGKGTGARLSRADMAAFMLEQIEDTTYYHQAPVISN